MPPAGGGARGGAQPLDDRPALLRKHILRVREAELLAVFVVAVGLDAVEELLDVLQDVGCLRAANLEARVPTVQARRFEDKLEVDRAGRLVALHGGRRAVASSQAAHEGGDGARGGRGAHGRVAAEGLRLVVVKQDERRAVLAHAGVAVVRRAGALVVHDRARDLVELDVNVIGVVVPAAALHAGADDRDVRLVVDAAAVDKAAVLGHVARTSKRLAHALLGDSRLADQRWTPSCTMGIVGLYRITHQAPAAARRQLDFAGS